MSTVATLGSATYGSYLVASLTASAAVAGPVVGAVIDRARRPRLGFAVAMAAMATGLAAIALVLGRLPLALVIIIAVVAGVGYPALTGAWSAQLPRLVPPDILARAYSSDAATYSLAAVVLPPVATSLVVVGDVAPLWFTVVILMLAMGTLLAVPLRARLPGPHQVTLRQDLRDGVGAITGRIALRRTAIITTIGFAGTAAIFVAAPVLAQSVGGSLSFTGVILGVFAIGGLISAAWFTRRPIRRPDRAVIISTVLSGVALVAVGLAPTTALLLLAAFAMGATEPPLVAGMFQVRVRESPERVQGQVFTTSASLRMTAFALSTAACGWLLRWGIPAVITFGFILHVAALAIGMLLGPPVPPRSTWLGSRPQSG